jgi:hypothetical protein
MVMPAQAVAVSFFRGDVTVGAQPTSIAVGNFNGGAPDLAVANEGSDNVSILLGNGFGQFTPATPVSVGDAPSSIVTGLFNADAFADLAIASIGNDNIAIRLGDGSGGFTGTGTVSTGASSDPRAIAAGDFSNDGKTDLISANNGSSKVSVLLGDGLGAFAVDNTPFDVSAATAIPTANPVSIAVGTFEAPDPPVTPDPDLDAIITSQTSDQVLELLGDGTGEFNGSGGIYTTMTSAMNPDPSAVAVGSLNPDNPTPTFAAEPDILVANQAPDNMWPGFGAVPGTSFQLGAPLSTGADPVAVALGDFDGDSDQDGISANRGAGTATVVLSNGNGGFEIDASPPVGSSPRAITTGTFDADGKADAAVANYDSNSVTILSSLQPGPPAATTPPPGITGPTPVKKKKCKKKKHRAATAKKKCKKKR